MMDGYSYGFHRRPSNQMVRIIFSIPYKGFLLNKRKKIERVILSIYGENKQKETKTRSSLVQWGMDQSVLSKTDLLLSKANPSSDQWNIHCLAYDHFVSSNDENREPHPSHSILCDANWLISAKSATGQVDNTSEQSAMQYL